MSYQSPSPFNRRLLLYALGAVLALAAAVIWLMPGGRLGGGGAPSARTTYSRDEFTKLVVGTRKEQLLKILGRPDLTQTTPDQWWYKRMTIDPATQTADRITVVVFTDGKATAVDYTVRDFPE
jgi:hypothetical protein